MRLSQQQLKFVRLLELNAPELDDAVEKELEANPALEVKEEAPAPETEYNRYTAYDTYGLRRQADDVPAFTPADEEVSIYDNLDEQLSERTLPPKVELAARYIIGNLDTNGYLRRSLPNLINDMAFGPGIGAFDLRDCLILQLEAMPSSSTRDDALKILREAYEAFVMKHKHRVVSQLRMSSEKVQAALDLILTLNPKPGASVGSNPADEASVIVPDFIVNNEEGEITISLNNRIPELQIDMSFRQAMDALGQLPRGKARRGSEYVVRNYNDARDFIKILSQRQQTMLAVMTAIVKIQKEYFLTEDVYKLRPMMIKNVAELTGLDLSVISRATANKYVGTPWGIFPLRFFFSDTIGEGAEGTDAATNRKIEAQIKMLVDAEDKRHPLSDQKIMEEMVARGFDLSRRTVAKYRDRLNIPVARLRKEL